MKNKDTSNLIFSAFLVTAFIICSYFFSVLIQDSAVFSDTLKLILMSCVYVVFGLVLFYATRVGDGKQVKRFSLSTLLIMILPSLYIIIAGITSNLPFSEQLNAHPQMINFASVAFGYGIPYTFLSGYELDTSKKEDTNNETVAESSDSDKNNDKSEQGEN